MCFGIDVEATVISGRWAREQALEATIRKPFIQI
jgi:hypothetical protein